MNSLQRTLVRSIFLAEKFEPANVGSHEKRGQDKVLATTKIRTFRFDLAGRTSKVREACGWAVILALRLDSAFRGFTRPCVSVNALRHTWGTGPVVRPRSLGSWRADGPTSYGDWRCHASKPIVWVSAGLPDPLPPPE